jgi:hypothetical protein
VTVCSICGYEIESAGEGHWTLTSAALSVAYDCGEAWCFADAHCPEQEPNVRRDLVMVLFS